MCLSILSDSFLHRPLFLAFIPLTLSYSPYTPALFQFSDNSNNIKFLKIQMLTSSNFIFFINICIP